MIEVLNPGFYTSIQDEGRRGFRHLGVPVSGPMDEKGFALALALLPFSNDTNVWECTLIGPTFLLHEAVRFVITGAEIEVYLNETPLEMFRVYTANAGCVLRLGKVKNGLRSYVRFEASLKLPQYLGSTSFYSAITGRKHIKKGEQFFVEYPKKMGQNPAHIRFDSSYIQAKKLTVYKGPDWDILPTKEQEKIGTHSFPVIAQNRMGYRLKGDIIAEESTLLSQLVIPGRVQLTPSGELLIATADCQVTGGYLQILQLTKESLATLAQKREGEKLTFQNIPH